jgi:hypothetical protein
VCYKGVVRRKDKAQKLLDGTLCVSEEKEGTGYFNEIS